jgi:DNA-binding MarR family transcriptional regulator
MQETSLIAYRKKLNDGSIGRQQAQILKLFVEHPECNYTNSEVTKLTGIKISTVCPRMKELRDNGLLICAGRRMCTVVKDSWVNCWRLNR